MNDDVVSSQEQPKLPSVLKNKNYLLILLGGFVSHVGQVFYSFAVGLYILEITHENSVIQGFYLGFVAIVMLLFTPIGGVIADRYNKAKIMYITDYIRGLAILASGFVVLTFQDNMNIQLVLLFIIAAILSINSSIFSPAASSITRFVVKPEQFQQASSYLSVASSLQGIIGLLFAGVFYSIFGIFWVFIFAGCAYILSAISEMFIRYTHIRPTTPTTVKNVFVDMKEGFSYLKTKKALVSVILIALGLNFFIAPMFSNGLPYFFKTALKDVSFLFDSFLTSDSWYAAIQITMSVGSLLAALIISRKVSKHPTARRIKSALIVTSVIIVLYAVAYVVLIDMFNYLDIYLIVMAAMMFIIGFALIYVNIPIGVSLMKTCDSQMLGKVSSLTSTLAQAAMPIGTILGGFIIAWFGLIGVMIFSSIGFAIITLYANINKPINDLL